jgi:cytochrome c-type biogenesis protein CcmH/NrfG
LAQALGGLRRWNEAIPAYREAIRLQPGNPEDYDAIGLAYLWIDKAPQAREAFQQATNLKRGTGHVKHELAKLGTKTSTPNDETAGEDSNPQEVPQSWSRTQPAVVTSPPRAAPGTVKAEEGSGVPRAAKELARQCASIRFSQHYADAADCYGRALRLAPNNAAIKQACLELAAWKSGTGCDF